MYARNRTVLMLQGSLQLRFDKHVVLPYHWLDITRSVSRALARVYFAPQEAPSPKAISCTSRLVVAQRPHCLGKAIGARLRVQ